MNLHKEIVKLFFETFFQFEYVSINDVPSIRLKILKLRILFFKGAILKKKLDMIQVDGTVCIFFDFLFFILTLIKFTCNC